MPSRGDLEIGRLERRADFLRVAKGKRWHGKALSLQAARRPDDQRPEASAAGPRIGFTLTRKVGGAVIRNRARRRLREAVRLSPALPVRADHDYVVIGRLEAIRLPFEALQSELARALIGVHDAGRQTRRPRMPAAPETAAAPLVRPMPRDA